MGKETEIQTCDSTVNPVAGCQGCELWTDKVRACYAGRYHEERLAKAHPKIYPPDFRMVRALSGRMVQAASWRDLRGTNRPTKPWLNGWPRIIFIGDMGDIFSHKIDFDWLFQEVILNVTSRDGRRHVWMLYTKQAERLMEFDRWLAKDRLFPWPQNLWAGVSVTSRATIKRIQPLVNTRAPFRFVSFEPLLEDLGDFPVDPGIRLGIIGGESGADARPCQVEWIRNVNRRLKAAGALVFNKQVGTHAMSVPPPPPPGSGYAPGEAPGTPWRMYLSHHKGGDPAEWPEDLRVREWPALEVTSA